MDEVHLHSEALAIDSVLARLMEVELRQSVGSLAKADDTTFAEIELDGVAVVDDRVGPRLPTKIERGLLGGDRLGEVDGGLLSAG
jgi:hypothetical protein